MQNQLDPDVVNLVKAIRDKESGGDFNARGKSGEIGAYQFTPDTWKAIAPKYGITNSIDKATPEEQNAVMYNRVKEWKDRGFDVTQIASMHNAGEGEPNSYTGKFSNGTSSVGTNKKGVNFNVPQYAEDIAKKYLQYKGQTPQTETTQPQENKSFLQKAEDVVTSIFPGKRIGEAIGTQIAKLMVPKEQRQFIPEGPTTSQVLGDIGQAALTTAAPGIGLEGGLLTRLGTGAALGAGLGATGAIANKEDISKGVLTGGTIGLGGGILGETINKLASFLPKSLMANALRGATPETLETAVNKPFMTIEGGFNTAQNTVKELGGQVDSILEDIIKNSPERALGSKADSIDKTILKFSGSGFTKEDIVSKIKSLVLNEKKFVDKVANGTATLLEKNELKKALNLKPGLFDKAFPELAENKKIGREFLNNLTTEIKSWAPDTQPLFEELQKEIQLRDLLAKNAKRLGKTRGIGLRDIVAMSVGAGAGGIPGAITGFALERGLQNPNAGLIAARGIQNAGKTAGIIGKAVKAPITNLLTNQD